MRCSRFSKVGTTPAECEPLAWVRCSVQRSRLLGLYQGEGDAEDTRPQDFLEFLEDFWRRRRLGELGEGVPIIDIVPNEPKKIQ